MSTFFNVCVVLKDAYSYRDNEVKRFLAGVQKEQKLPHIIEREISMELYMKVFEDEYTVVPVLASGICTLQIA